MVLYAWVETKTDMLSPKKKGRKTSDVIHCEGIFRKTENFSSSLRVTV